MNADPFSALPVSACLRREASGAVVIRVHLVPNATRTELDGLHDGALKLRLNAPPVDGKANDALVRWLATTLGIGRSDISLLRGHTSRRKELRISAIAAAAAHWHALGV